MSPHQAERMSVIGGGESVSLSGTEMMLPIGVKGSENVLLTQSCLLSLRTCLSRASKAILVSMSSLRALRISSISCSACS